MNLLDKISEYMTTGGLFNPEHMEHDKVRQLVMDCRAELNKYGHALMEIRSKIEEAVCTEGCDKGVVMLDHQGTTHYDKELKVNVYDHEYFSPLGDALIAIHDLTKPGETE